MLPLYNIIAYHKRKYLGGKTFYKLTNVLKAYFTARHLIQYTDDSWNENAWIQLLSEMTKYFCPYSVYVEKNMVNISE